MTIRPAHILHIALPLLLSSSALGAVPCVPVEVEPHSAYRYLDAFATALGYTKQAIHETDSTTAGNTEKDVAATMVALKLGTSDLGCAMALIDPYRPPVEAGTHARKAAADTSWDAKRVEMIGLSAGAAYASLAAIRQEEDQKIALFEQALNGSVKSGTLVRQGADLTDKKHTAMRMLLNSSIGATWCAVEPDSVTGQMTHLVLTARERDDILNTLRTWFGEKALTDQSDPDPEVPTATAALLYRFLSEPGRIARPE